MVKEKYLLRAESLAKRNKNRLNENHTPKEKETDELFYWIMTRLEWELQGSSTQTSYSITIKEDYLYSYGRVLLEHGRVSEYLSEYVKKEEFYAVMEDVANIFNQIGKSEEKGYQFYATCLIPNNKNEMAEMTVHMITKK